MDSARDLRHQHRNAVRDLATSSAASIKKTVSGLASSAVSFFRSSSSSHSPISSRPQPSNPVSLLNVPAMSLTTSTSPHSISQTTAPQSAAASGAGVLTADSMHSAEPTPHSSDLIHLGDSTPVSHTPVSMPTSQIPLASLASTSLPVSQVPLVTHASASMPVSQTPLASRTPASLPVSQPPLVIQAPASLPVSQASLASHTPASLPVSQPPLVYHAPTSLPMSQIPMVPQASASLPVSQAPLVSHTPVSLSANQPPLAYHAPAPLPMSQSPLVNPAAPASATQPPLLPVGHAAAHATVSLPSTMLNHHATTSAPARDRPALAVHAPVPVLGQPTLPNHAYAPVASQPSSYTPPPILPLKLMFPRLRAHITPGICHHPLMPPPRWCSQVSTPCEQSRMLIGLVPSISTLSVCLLLSLPAMSNTPSLLPHPLSSIPLPRLMPQSSPLLPSW